MLIAPPRSRGAALVLAVALLLAGCSSTDDGAADEPSGGTGTLEGNRATASGVSFEVPEGWTSVDPVEVADGAADDEAVQGLAEGLGVAPEELESAIAGVDLFVFEDGGRADGFLDNINVTSPGGDLPTQDQLETEFSGLGATVGVFEEVETDLGNSVTLTYQLPVGATEVQGEVIAVEVDGASVAVTVSTTDPDLTEEIAAQVLDSLGEAE